MSEEAEKVEDAKKKMGMPSQTDPATPAASTSREPTILVLSGAVQPLLPSDFFRIAPIAGKRRIRRSKGGGSGAEKQEQTQPKDTDEPVLRDWAAAGGGLYKVVQDRHPNTLEPTGAYLLYFGSPAAAIAYAQEARDLHRLARRALQTPRHRNPARFHELTGNLSDLRFSSADIASAAAAAASAAAAPPLHDAAAALRAFSLVPPTAQLDLKLQIPDIATLSSSADSTAPNKHYLDDDARHAALVDTRTKVLVVLRYTSGSDDSTGPGSEPVHGVLTIQDLRQLLADDGVDRNLPWPVPEGLNGVMPVPWIVAERKRLQEKMRQQQLQKLREEQQRYKKRLKEHKMSREGSSADLPPPPPPPPPPPTLLSLPSLPLVPKLRVKTDKMNEHARYSRFVVAFTDLVEARRFVRGWHRRTVPAPPTTSSGAPRTAVLDVSVLW